jgi:hypothetical protein
MPGREGPCTIQDFGHIPFIATNWGLAAGFVPRALDVESEDT